MKPDRLVPSPEELVRAYRVLRKLSRATFNAGIQDRAGSPAWDGLVEGGRCLAITTAALGESDPRYAEAWERMLSDG